MPALRADSRSRALSVPADPSLDYARRLPTRRPTGLRLHTITGSWFRLDSQDALRWNWTPFGKPRYRFDSATGMFRVRYAGDAQRVAMRERFDAEGRIVSAHALGLTLVQLTGRLRVLDLRTDRTLDVLGLDDQINTSRAPGVWAAGQQLTDLVHGWHGQRCHGIVYRSRTTPQRSSNLAFLEHAPLTATSLGRLGEQTSLLATSVVSDGFTVEGSF